MRRLIRRYYELTKPGIVYGNIFTTLAGFLFASRWQSSGLLLAATLSGVALVIASACVFNNYLDRNIDRKMTRTKSRGLVTGDIHARPALLYATVLGLIGFFLLFVYVNLLTVWVVLVGFIFYVALYSLSKRWSHWGTVVGSVSGAVPIVAGYTAVVDRLDLPVFLLFLILVLWQMPHFYAIAMYRLEDYKEAGIPVLPAKKGMRTTKIYIVAYIAAFLIAVSLPTVFGYAGDSYLAAVLLVSLIWLGYAMRGFTARDDAKWARKVFFMSLIVLVAFSVAISVLPLWF